MSQHALKDTILGRIVEDTIGLVQQQKRERPLSSLLGEVDHGRTPHSLAAALSAPGLSVIAEIKKASPSKGVIREDFHPVQLADSYRSGGAAALSVLTEPLHFQGHPDFLRQVRAEVDLPLLRKDFIVDPYQMAQARAWGADAVLLIAACLDRTHLAELQAAAAEYGLETLVELYDPRELDHVDLDRTRIVGVNSRDLRSFEVNLDQCIETLLALPGEPVRVAESGLSSVADFARVRDAGIEAVLVGESFMRAPDPGAALNAILESLS
jgi:indole-3-glycerol phosphate synthase